MNNVLQSQQHCSRHQKTNKQLRSGTTLTSHEQRQTNYLAFKGDILCPFYHKLIWFLWVLMKCLQHTLVKIPQGSFKTAPFWPCLKQPSTEWPVLSACSFKCSWASPPPSSRCARLAFAHLATHYLCRTMATGDEDSILQPYRFEPESDPEQEEAPEQVREFRAQQDISEWQVNFVTSTFIFLFVHWLRSHGLVIGVELVMLVTRVRT